MSIFRSIDISSSGLRAGRVRMDVIAASPQPHVIQHFAKFLRRAVEVAAPTEPLDALEPHLRDGSQGAGEVAFARSLRAEAEIVAQRVELERNRDPGCGTGNRGGARSAAEERELPSGHVSWHESNPPEVSLCIP